ncbi:LacI family DNA-binding transcriptional regulator [Streptomyces sp. NPDC020917]|uniref:LacI family DNA-binding transcriptional regulator n=1 Tax=Streptomyces sp. NPDC020917 TaxID=3365102 RepID=UPI0037AA6BDC
MTTDAQAPQAGGRRESRPGEPGAAPARRGIPDAPRVATRADVARLAGCSSAVVSYVVNGGPRSVAPATRERVLAAIDELGYRPNAVARALRKRATSTIALLVPDISNPFFADFARAVQDAAFDRGKVLLMGDSGGNVLREEAYLERFVDEQVEGIVVIGASRASVLRAVGASPVRAVALDRPLHGAGIPFVGIDNQRAAFEATRHLLDHGHRRVACLAGPDDQSNATARLAGWAQALHGAGVAAGPDLVGVHPFSAEGGEAGGRALLDVPADRRPTAVFVSSDSQAEGLLAVARRMGLSIPEDLAVFGFDGTRRSVYSEPAMSVVEQPVRAAAAAAVDLLQNPPPAGAPLEHRILDFSLVLRRSCGCTGRTPSPEPLAPANEGVHP